SAQFPAAPSEKAAAVLAGPLARHRASVRSLISLQQLSFRTLKTKTRASWLDLEARSRLQRVSFPRLTKFRRPPLRFAHTFRRVRGARNRPVEFQQIPNACAHRQI